MVRRASEDGLQETWTALADAAYEAELDDVYETERRLLYVACTRAREHLVFTGQRPGSEYLVDFTE
ncbi:ATP-binding domain-containing protein [Rhizobium leguminosarum]|nr:ATP-binding domain-containing protein [Rhizobium leguminosarum]NKM08744.1 hypothetical protein [Rhizobium leguminosarum bv. viciae]